MQKSLSGLTERISDILAGSHLIKLFNLGDYITNIFRKQNNVVLAIGEKRAKINAVYQGVNTFVWMGSFVGIIAIASVFMALGYIQLGTIVALVQLQNGVTQLFNTFGRFVNQLQKSMAGFERIVELLASLFTIEEIRELFAYVPQEPYLFSGTVYENISYGRENVSAREIIEGAKSAYAHEFIQVLENGYDTLVGERGCFLSGGQKQRVAIARAIIKNAEILLLDEATSALDNESEALVQSALEKLMKEKTAIVIAHRLSTVENADRILVMDGGSIVEEGTHEQLLEKGGLYSKLFKVINFIKINKNN